AARARTHRSVRENTRAPVPDGGKQGARRNPPKISAGLPAPPKIKRRIDRRIWPLLQDCPPEICRVSGSTQTERSEGRKLAALAIRRSVPAAVPRSPVRASRREPWSASTALRYPDRKTT